VTGLEYSAATELSNVPARGSAVARLRFGQEGEQSGEEAVCCDPPVFADSSWDTPRAYRLDENRVDQSAAANRADPNSNTVQTCEYRLHYAITLWQSAQSGNSLNKANSLEIPHMVWKQLIPFSKYSYSRNPE
jgi:hypothetical protein